MPTVALCVLDVVWQVGHAPATLNIVHPRGTPWNTVMNGIGDALHIVRGQRMPLVPFVEWFKLLESSAKTARRENLEDIVRFCCFGPPRWV